MINDTAESISYVINIRTNIKTQLDIDEIGTRNEPPTNLFPAVDDLSVRCQFHLDSKKEPIETQNNSSIILEEPNESLKPPPSKSQTHQNPRSKRLPRHVVEVLTSWYVQFF